MTSNRRTIYTLAVLAAVLITISGVSVYLLGGPGVNSPRQAEAMTSKRLEALKVSLEAATEYVNTGKDEEASAILEKLAQEYPTEPLVWEQLSEVRLHMGRVDEAYAMILKTIDLGRDTRDLEFNAGLVATGLDKIDEAIIHLQQACRLAPTDIQAPLYLANLYRKTNEIPKAQQQLLHILDINKNEPMAWGGLAQIAFLEDKRELAEQYLAKARELAPEFPTWQVLEAKLLRRRGKPEAAITMLCALGPEVRYSQEVVNEVAQCWALMSLPLKAAQEHADFLNQKPDALASAISASRFFLMGGDREQAESWLAYAVRLAPEAKEVQDLAKQFEPPTPDQP